MERRIETVDSLRGLAALAVCWHHFTVANDFVHPGFFKTSGTYGWAGVEVFFVISGFVLPYALQRGGYRLSDILTFLAKRVTRLDPPYILSIAIAILVNYGLTLAPHYTGQPFGIEPIRVLLHLAYLNVLAGYKWLNPVYWTLAIEFQYYLLICLVFPVIAAPRLYARLGLFAVLSLLAWEIRSGTFIFPFLFLFMMGMALFQRRVGLSRRLEFVILESLFIVGSFVVLGTAATVAGALAMSAIAVLSIRNRPLLFLGTISYSLYLMHSPISTVVFTLGRRFATSDERVIVLVAVALLITVAGSYVSYLLVERPSQRWSARFQYQRNRSPELLGDRRYHQEAFDLTPNPRAQAE